MFSKKGGRGRKIVYISEIKVKNFKSFKGEHIFEFKKGINYLVGDNNSGKTTVFDAVDFLLNAKNSESYINNSVSKGEEVSVTMSFDDVNLSEVEELKDFVKENKLIVKRSSGLSDNDFQVKNGEFAKTDIGKILTYKNEYFEYFNKIKNSIDNLFEPQFIYASINNSDFQNFSSSKELGSLIEKISEDFRTSDSYKQFDSKYQEVFGDGDNGIKQNENFKEAIDKINQKLNSQFGKSEIDIKFDVPKTNEFIKNGSIKMTDDNAETDASDKGMGLQRALALAILQVESEMFKKHDSVMPKYFIDEPEIYLHPRAQDKLMESLRESNEQIFITTHSPYIMKDFRDNLDTVTILSTRSGDNRVDLMKSPVLSPTTVGEIAYRAYGVSTVEFHQQLFSSLYMIFCEDTSTSADKSLFEFDKYLKNYKVIKDSTYINMFERKKGIWVKEKNSDDYRQREYTLPYFIRNEIDHPEIIAKGFNDKYTDEQLKKSIELMLDVYKQVKM